MGVSERFLISQNNYEFTKFRHLASDFAGWAQKSRWVKLVKNFKIFLQKQWYEIWIN